MEETRVVLRNVGKIDPHSLADYHAAGGYGALKKALEMSPDKIVDLMQASGLRGRGGAGFPLGRKWGIVAKSTTFPKYVISNADEGEPATNKDRVIMSGDPHSMLEGMAIAGYAVGANQGYVYLRYEYPALFPLLEEAIEQAKAAGVLGYNIFDSGFDFDITVCSGGGAYVCGEETALINSIEGKRGEPRFKPPYPGEVGLYNKPTVVNNVETLANVPVIIEKGVDWFRSIGTETSPGTKVFTLCGNVENRGIFEFPMGVNLRDLIEEAGGGVKYGQSLLGVQLGGCSGTILNASQIDLIMDVDSCVANGASLGSGAIKVIADYNDLLDVVENITSFFVHESCGQCTPCREGSTRLYEIIKKIKNGEAQKKDIDTMLDLCFTMRVASLCGLGQAATVPVESSYNNFRSIYDNAIAKGARI